MLALLLVAALQTQTPSGAALTGPAFRGSSVEEVEADEAPAQNLGQAGADAPEERERQPRDRAGRPLDDRFATPQGAPPQPSRRVTVPNPHDPEPADQNPH